MSQQFDYAKWRLTQCDDPKPMEKLLRHLRNDTVVGKQIAEIDTLLQDYKNAKGTATAADG